jgi:homeobox protein cut-like
VVAEVYLEFKKQTPDLHDHLKVLLKDYQTEIDNSAKRSKQVEGWFLSLYKVLVEVPDPCPILTTTLTELKRLDALENLEKENKLLKDQTSALQIALDDEKSQDAMKWKLQVENYQNMVWH